MLSCSEGMSGFEVRKPCATGAPRVTQPLTFQGAGMSELIYPADGVLLGRARVSGIAHPVIVTVRNGDLVDITARGMATVRDIAESADPAGYVAGAPGKSIGSADAVIANSWADV